MQKVEAQEKEEQKGIGALTAKNLMALSGKGASKVNLQPINEEGPDGKAVSEQIYVDPEDPKKKK